MDTFFFGLSLLDESGGGGLNITLGLAMDLLDDTGDVGLLLFCC